MAIDSERRALMEEQNILMELYEEIESAPEQYGDNFQKKLDALDVQADKIRWTLEGGEDDL